MSKVKHNARRMLSVFLAFVLCFSSLILALPVKADAATAGSYYVTLTVQVTDDADGWDVSKFTLYYKTNNGTGTQQSVVLVDTPEAVGDKKTYTFSRTVNGFPTGYTHEYSFGGGFTWRTFEENVRISVGSSSSNMKEVFSATDSDSSGAFSAAKGTFDHKNGVASSNYPHAASVGSISGSSSITVPTNGTSTSSTYSAVVKDQYGVNWYQNPTWSVNNTKVSMNASSGQLSVTSTSNAANDYTVTVKATSGSASASKTVTIRTFDYAVSFLDEDGTVLKTRL